MIVFFIKTLMNVDKIYSYLLKLKLNLRIGPNSNLTKKTLSMVTKINAFTLSKKIGKNSPSPNRKTNGLAVPNKKNQIERASLPPYLLYQVQQQNFKDVFIL